MSNYTKTSLKNDVKDSAKEFGIDYHAMHAASDALGLTDSGISYQRTEPNQKSPMRHYHTEQEELYVVLSGSGSIDLDDEVIPIAPLDAIRVAKEAHRSFTAGPDGLEFIAFGYPRTGNDVGKIVS
jgi:uncharacterized cupin superfamily protein